MPQMSRSNKTIATYDFSASMILQKSSFTQWPLTHHYYQVRKRLKSFFLDLEDEHDKLPAHQLHVLGRVEARQTSLRNGQTSKFHELVNRESASVRDHQQSPSFQKSREGSIPRLRDNNIVYRSMATSKARQSDLHDHVCGCWRGCRMRVEIEFAILEIVETRAERDSAAGENKTGVDESDVRRQVIVNI